MTATASAADDTPIRDNSAAQRYEMTVDGGADGPALAFVAYRLQGDNIMLDHAEVPAALEGRGVGSALVKATLEAVRVRNLKVVARCGFVRAYLRRHPEFNDLIR